MNRYAMLVEYTWLSDITGNEHKQIVNYTSVARNVDEAIKDAQQYYKKYSNVVVKNIFSEPYKTPYESY